MLHSGHDYPRGDYRHENAYHHSVILPCWPRSRTNIERSLPVKESGDMKDQEKREACEAKFIERQRDIRNNPEKYIEKAIRRSEEAEWRARRAEEAAEEAERKARHRW